MIERIKGLADAIPDHWTHIFVVFMGACVSLLHAPHAYETGSGLMAAGLTMYRGKPTNGNQ